MASGRGLETRTPTVFSILLINSSEGKVGASGVFPCWDLPAECWEAPSRSAGYSRVVYMKEEFKLCLIL